MSLPIETILAVHAVATLAMTGIIWFVQIVHYPLFVRVGVRQFARYEQEHARATSFVVAPLMLVEAAAALSLCAVLRSQPLVWIALLVLVGVWLSTFLVQVPLHRQLSRGFDAAAHRRLVRTNWWRTAGWTARAALALVLWAPTR